MVLCWCGQEATNGAGTCERCAFLEVLGLSFKATPLEVKEAYRRKAKELHPDIHGRTPAEKADCESRMAKVNAARAYLEAHPFPVLARKPREEAQGTRTCDDATPDAAQKQGVPWDPEKHGGRSRWQEYVKTDGKLYADPPPPPPTQPTSCSERVHTALEDRPRGGSFWPEFMEGFRSGLHGTDRPAGYHPPSSTVTRSGRFRLPRAGSALAAVLVLTVFLWKGIQHRFEVRASEKVTLQSTAPRAVKTPPKRRAKHLKGSPKARRQRVQSQAIEGLQ